MLATVSRRNGSHLRVLQGVDDAIGSYGGTPSRCGGTDTAGRIVDQAAQSTAIGLVASAKSRSRGDLQLPSAKL
jgi:hypothetical protein